jgi:hypothetical protein
MAAVEKHEKERPSTQGYSIYIYIYINYCRLGCSNPYSFSISKGRKEAKRKKKRTWFSMQNAANSQG